MEKSKSGYLSRFWSEERNLTWLLVALVLDAFIVDPMATLLNGGLAVQLINSLTFSAILLMGLFTIARHKVTLIIFTGITVLIISVRFGRLVFGENWLLVWDIALSMISIVTFVIVLLIYVYMEEATVTIHRIRGAVAAYLLIAIAFAFGYQLIEFLVPGAFLFKDTIPKFNDIHLFYYFSACTLTTLGYGDVTPIHPYARSLAMMEAFIGQLYPAILLARLVTLYVATGRTNKDK